MSDSIIEEFVLWKPIKVVSVILYALIIIIFPFNGFWATILLFALICFWSRIPAMISVFTKECEVIDFFTVILALDVGGFFAGVFGASLMMFTRIFGPREWFPFTVRNTVGMFLGGVLSPLVYEMCGSTLITMYSFTAIRYVTLIVMCAIFEPEFLMLEIGLSFTNGISAYISNTFLVTLFAKPLAEVVADGAVFDMKLFLIATLVIGGFYAASKVAKWLEVRRMRQIKAGVIKPWAKKMIFELDAEVKPMPLFVQTT
jgi:hypothetical protein